MAIILRGEGRRAARLAASNPTALVVSVGDATSAKAPVVRVGVSVRDKALARRIAGAMTRALRIAVASRLRVEALVVRVPSRKAFDRVKERLPGAIAVVPVTARNRRRLVSLVESLRAAGVAGIQLAWDGRDPSRETVEASVFAALEHARATPGRAPVVLAPSERLVESLRILAGSSEP